MQRSVSAVLRLRDGFLGTPIENGGALFRIDGMPSQPQAKPGRVPGLDRPRGRTAHPVGQHARFPDRGNSPWISGPVRCGKGSADLKPGLGYPFGKDAVTVRLTVTRGGQPLADQPVWLAVADPAPLKLAQDKAEKGAQDAAPVLQGER